MTTTAHDEKSVMHRDDAMTVAAKNETPWHVPMSALDVAQFIQSMLQSVGGCDDGDDVNENGRQNMVPGDALATAALLHELQQHDKNNSFSCLSSTADVAITQTIVRTIPRRPANNRVEWRRTHTRGAKATGWVDRGMGIQITGRVWKETLGIEALLFLPQELLTSTSNSEDVLQQGDGATQQSMMRRHQASGSSGNAVLVTKDLRETIHRWSVSAAVSFNLPIVQYTMNCAAGLDLNAQQETHRLAAFGGDVEYLNFLLQNSPQRRMLLATHVPVSIAISILCGPATEDVWKMFPPANFGWSWANATPDCLKNHKGFFTKPVVNLNRAGEPRDQLVPFVEIAQMQWSTLMHLMDFLCPVDFMDHRKSAAERASMRSLRLVEAFAGWVEFFLALCVHRDDVNTVRYKVLPFFGADSILEQRDLEAQRRGKQQQGGLSRKAVGLPSEHGEWDDSDSDGEGWSTSQNGRKNTKRRRVHNFPLLSLQNISHWRESYGVDLHNISHDMYKLLFPNDSIGATVSSTGNYLAIELYHQQPSQSHYVVDLHRAIALDETVSSHFEESMKYYEMRRDMLDKQNSKPIVDGEDNGSSGGSSPTTAGSGWGAKSVAGKDQGLVDLAPTRVALSAKMAILLMEDDIDGAKELAAKTLRRDRKKTTAKPSVEKAIVDGDELGARPTTGDERPRVPTPPPTQSLATTRQLRKPSQSSNTATTADWTSVPLKPCGLRVTVQQYLGVLEGCGYSLPTNAENGDGEC